MSHPRPWLDRLIANQLEVFVQRTPASARLAGATPSLAPAGVGTQLHSHDPYPLAIASGAGSRVLDLDGNEYVDLSLGFGTMVSGHAHPTITEAISRRAELGVHFGTASTEAREYLETLTARFGFEQAQLTNSGSEATALAVRVARAFTGNPWLLKVEGGYHGTTEPLMISTHPALSRAGADRTPDPVPWGSCHASGSLAQTRVIPFNDLDAARHLIRVWRPGALIIEPVLLNVSFISPEPGYLEGLAELCRDEDVLLIFDEVKTGCTIGPRGASGHFGVHPDLICLGKGIGGGIPMGAVLGSTEILSVVASGEAPHYSTFAANPLACAAGSAALESVLTRGAVERASRLNERLRIEGPPILDAAGIPARIVGIGLKGTVVFWGDPLRDYREYETLPDHELGFLWWLVMVNHGVLLSPGQDEQWTVSVAHTDADIDHVLAALEAFAALVATARP
ncbi:aspartate aminotransferase family protein [Miltoncostaea oceani]|uniref:aspartate aminotransferase family protein n=1 Tax=Miltoncostaea oceani TaxID=2843216 RepID=UPI001C3CECB1|nr:aminotransferase class III-fold pyridoxal phosphate-dependent enzyme [Miltoncostaea oceani]